MLRLAVFGNRAIAASFFRRLSQSHLRFHVGLRILISDERTRKVAQHYGLEFAKWLSNASRNEEMLLSLMTQERVQVILSVQHNWVLSERILCTVDWRAWNLHNAKLPDFQGFNGVSHAILRGDKDHISTVHWMEKAVDSGPIAYEESTPIKESDTALSLYRRTVPASTAALMRLLDDLVAEREIPRTPMATDQGQFYSQGSVEILSNLDGATDNDFLTRVRACYFPPKSWAFVEVGGCRMPVLPGREGSALLSRVAPANEWEL